MVPTKLQARRPYTALTRLMLVALVINALAYASELIWIGRLDREISIVVACVILTTILIATGWRWTPIVGLVVAGGPLIASPFLLYNLSLPVTSGFFLAAVIEVLSGLLVVGAGIGALFQNYRNNK